MKFLPKTTHCLQKNKISFYKVILVPIFAISPIFFYTETAHAGFFSFISGITSDSVSAETIKPSPAVNSQNMILPQAAVNIDPNPHKNDDYMPLAYGNAFVAEIGPQGTVSEVSDEVSTEISLYTVHKGDTLSEIASMFGVSVNTIVWANELGKNPIIMEGQQLVILPITGIKYTVKKGDTIKGIVSRYKVNLDEVLQYNDLSLNSTLVAGNIILIPDAELVSDTPKIAIKTTTTKGQNSTYYPGYYTRPIDGGTRSQGIHGNNGVDLAAPVGTIIHASAAGKVISSISNGAWNGGYGNYVIIAHDNGTQTMYAHTQKNFVSTGDTVEQGQMIAKIGMTGKTTGPHIHFEIRGAKNPF